MGLVVVATAALLSGCGPEAGAETAATPNRTLLTRDFLQGTGTLDEPLPTLAFMLTSDSSTATENEASANRFEGRLVIDTGAMPGGFEKVVDLFDQAATGESPFNTLPPFDFEFVQSGDHLIPVLGGRQRSEHPYWEISLAPGKVWQEAGDAGWSRAALPFALHERNANCTHNGVLSFVFSAGGEISRAAYQIGSETCHYFQVNLWGVLPARYEPGPVPDAVSVTETFTAQQAARLPVRPLTQLTEDYPAVDLQQFALHDPSEVSTYGFVIGGVHYSGGCPTRFGPYPFCESLTLPSYSLAKTIFAATVYLQMEQQFPGAGDLLVTDYVPECRLPDGRWDGVTLGELLDMSSGNYRSTVDQEDEFFSYTGEMFSAGDHATKITAACNLFPRQAEPGTVWVYHTSETYIAGTLMNAWLKARKGQSQDIFNDLLAAEILTPLHFSPVFQETLRSYDEVAQPFAGYGLSLQSDDIARFALFLLEDRGRVNGTQVLDPAQLSASLQQDVTDPGMTVDARNMRYNNAMWAATVLPPEACPEPVWIPFMSGYGGISVALLPNDSVYYVFSDGAHFRWAEAAIESHQLKSFCEVDPP